MDALQSFLNTVAMRLWGDWLLFALIGIGILYTVGTGFVQVRHAKYIYTKTLLEPLRMKRTDSTEPGTISSFQALCTALASCVGSGNIVGVSTAVLMGGPGAIFWMWVAAFFGMATKYGEIILGMQYRQKNSAGQYVGGPFYYIRDGLKAPWLAILCAAFMVTQIIGGNFIQSNTISNVLYNNYAVPYWATGIVLTVCILTVALGGLKRLAYVAQKLVPFMATLYVLGGLAIILVNIHMLPSACLQILTGAFSLEAAEGGAAGTIMLLAMQRGVARGLYSNEAGEGSAPVIHSAAQVQHPCQQGIFGVSEVFIDTFILCTITGLVLGVTGIAQSGADASALVINAFASVWEPLRYPLILSLLLFCTTTLMSQWYFGFVGLNYLFGFKVADKFKYVFPFFCSIGAMLKIDMVWTIQDIALGLLIIPNLIAMLFLFPHVRRATQEFFADPARFDLMPPRT